MSLLPTDIVDDEKLEEELDEKEVPREYEINFETGQLTGNIVEGIQAIKVWIWLALQVKRYNHTIYTWDYGTEIDDLIGKGYSSDYIESEAERMTEECLLMNENITGISDFKIEINGTKASIAFVAETVYGEVEVNV